MSVRRHFLDKAPSPGLKANRETSPAAFPIPAQGPVNGMMMVQEVQRICGEQFIRGNCREFALSYL
jgi:hypothetical protein